MASIFNHDGAFGVNPTGKDRFRSVQNPMKLFGRAIDYADFAYTTGKSKVGMSDIDAIINLGRKKDGINIIVEFKEAKGSPMRGGQLFTLQDMAIAHHIKSVFYNKLESESDRQPGCMSIIVVASHGDSQYSGAAEATVDKVFFAHEGVDRAANGWQDYTDRDLTLAQFLEIFASALLHENPKSLQAAKLLGMAESGVRESGQQSRLKK